MAQQHAFHTLLPPQEQALRRRALKLTANPHRAEDLVQATFLKAWMNRDKYKADTQLRAWLFTILRNTFFSDLRKSRREVEDTDGYLTDSLLEEPRQVDTIALNELMSAIASLPESQRKPLILMGVFGFSQLEAAKSCGCTVGTIKSRVSRGRAALSLAVSFEADVREQKKATDYVSMRPANGKMARETPGTRKTAQAMCSNQSKVPITRQELLELMQAPRSPVLKTSDITVLRKRAS